MTDSERPTRKKAGSLWSSLRSKPAALVVAGVVGAGLAGAYALPQTNFAFAQTGGDSKQTTQQTVQTPYGAAPLSFADLVEKVAPAVVSVQVSNGGDQGGEREFRGIPDLPEDHPLNEFFERFRRGDPDERPQRPSPSRAQGSGFIISEDGYVVTNHHVVEKANEILLTTNDGEEYTAEVVGSDERTDLAVLKIEADKTFPTVEFSDDPARVGDWTLAVGNPFGLGGTVTAGIISAHNRDIGASPYSYLQIDAAVNRGNSGGPAFNLQGQVIGVNTAIFSPSGGNVGIAFAVPAELAKKVVTQLRETGKVSRGWLGVTIQNVNEDIAMSLDLEETRGAIVTRLSAGGPAAKSDLEVGDVIVRVNEQKIEDSRDLARTIADFSPDTKVTVGILRDGEKMEIPVTLGTFPSEDKLAALRSGEEAEPDSPGSAMNELGLSLAPASEKSESGDEGVVIVEIDPDGKAANKGLQPGDVILEVAGTAVQQPEDVANGIEAAKKRGRKAVSMLVRSGDRQLFVAIPLEKT